MATPKQIYLPEIDSTIEIPEGMDEIKAKERAIQIFQKKFPNQYSEINSAYEFNKKYIKSFDEDQPANSAPVETQNTDKANLPAKGAANFNIAKLAFGLPEVIGGYAGNKIADLIGLPKNEEALDNQRKDSDALYKGLESGLSANLTNPVKAGAASVIDELYQLVGKSPKRSLGESYDLYRQSQKEDQAKTLKESPISNILGQITGAVMPVGVGGQLFTKGGKVISSLTGGGKLEKTLPALKKIVDAILTGGSTNLAYQAIDPEVDVKNPLKTFLTGAAFNSVPTVIGEGGKKVFETGKNIFEKSKPYLNNNQSKIKGIMDSVGEFLFNRKYRKGMEELGKLGLDDKQKVVSELKASVGDLKNKIFTPYGDLKKSLYQKYGKERVSGEKITSQIKQIFEDEGLTWGKNKLNLNPLKKYSINADKVKNFKDLENLYKNLIDQKVPLNEIKQILSSVKEKAKFLSGDRGDYEALMGSLYNKTKGSIDDAVGNLAGGKTKEVFQNMRKNVSDLKQTLGKQKDIGNIGLEKTLKKAPEQIIDSIKTNLRPSYIKEVITKYPSLKGSVEKIVLSNFFNKATDPQSLARLIKNYGEKELGQILSKEKFALLQRMIGNKEFFQKIKSNGWSGLKSFLPKTIDTLTE